MPEKVVRKKSALQKHKDSECGCSMFTNPHNCIYQPFLDGWDFTPDVGNGKTRGEIFTPRFIIDKMLLEVRIFPPEGIYDLNYSIPANEALERVQARSNEPAIGTANFTSAILWHKLEYAAIAAKNKSGKINRKKYDLYTLMAVASIYANDIDPGNLTTTMLRLTRKDKVNSPAHVNRWVEHVLSFGSEEDRDKVTQQITQSLESANNIWHEHLKEEGVLYRQYKRHTNDEPDEWLTSMWDEIIMENIKFFNGIATDTVNDEKGIVPGWHTVSWAWWDFEYDEQGQVSVTKKMVPMTRQVYLSQLKSLQKTMMSLHEKRTMDEKGKLVHTDPKEKKAYADAKREIKKILSFVKENNLDYQHVPGSVIEKEEELDLFSLLDE